MKKYDISIGALLNLLHFTAPEERLLSFVLTEGFNIKSAFPRQENLREVHSKFSYASAAQPGNFGRFRHRGQLPCTQVSGKDLYYYARHTENLNILRHRKQREQRREVIPGSKKTKKMQNYPPMLHLVPVKGEEG